MHVIPGIGEKHFLDMNEQYISQKLLHSRKGILVNFGRLIVRSFSGEKNRCYKLSP